MDDNKKKQMSHAAEVSKKYKKIIQWADRQKPETADAVVWTQGDRYDRGYKTLSLFRRGLAKRIVLTGNNVLVGEKAAPDTDNITLKEMEMWLQKHGVPKNKIITDSRSFNTAEQAQNSIALAKKNGWNKLLLVASFYHQPRVFLSFLKSAEEQKWKGRLINQSTAINWEMIPGGRKRSARIIAIEEIKKIKKYNLENFLNKAIILFNIL